RETAVNRLVSLCAAGVLAGGIFLSAVGAQQPASLPEPRKGFGASVTPAFEGWYYNADGSRSFLIGYYNRNSQQELDIPIGPNNRLEPGGPDMGQPTHCLPGREWGMFAISVREDFKPADAYMWPVVWDGRSGRVALRRTSGYCMSSCV